jgi:hypothetical protein
MSWKPHIFKPRWQHRDADLRKQAVATLDEPELLAALDEICVTDEDPGVRAAAAVRVNDLGVLNGALGTEQDAAVIAALRQRIGELAAATGTHRPPLELRLEVIAAAQDRDLLERVASSAPEPQLRSAALQRVGRQGFLGDRAIHDPDPEVRQAAARAITQRSTLQRVIDETRTRDKALHQSLLARLKTELLEAGDPDTVRQEAQQLCEALEAYAIEQRSVAASVPAAIEQRWALIAERAPKDLASRFQRASTRVTTAEIPAPAPPPPVAAVAASEADHAPAEPAAPAEPPEPVEPIEPGPSSEAQQRAASAAAEARSRALEQAQALLARYRSEAEEGLLHKALETRQELQALGAGLKSDRRWKAVQAEINALHGRLRELRDWHHWSNDTVRKQLIKEMALLPKADLHPDAMLDRIKSLQQQWKELERSEQIQGEQHFAAAPWLWRKFQAAGNAAFSAAKPFLEKRSELQEKHAQDIQQRIATLKELTATESPDWAALGTALKQAQQCFRALDQTPQKARKKLASQLRKTIEKAKPMMESRYDQIELEKRKLIRAAEQLVHMEDRDEAIQKAKQLQADWKAAGSLWRSRENPLWDAFRTPIDPLFADLKVEREEQQEAQQERRAAQQSLCNELKAILATDDAELAEAEGKLRGLRGAWNDIEFPDRKIRAHFDRMAQDFETRLRAYRQRSAEETRQRWWQKAALLHECEAAGLQGGLKPAAQKKLAAQWPGAGVNTETDRLLDQRFATAQAGESTLAFDAATLERAQELCIQLEFLSVLPSPEDERGRRMEYQVQRLASSLAGEGRQQSAADEARQAELDWLTLPPLEPAAHAQLTVRVKAALKEIYGHF